MKVEVRGTVVKHVVLVGDNGEVVLTSETYFNRSNAERAAKRLRAALGSL